MGNVPGRFSFLRAKLCAGSPKVIAVIVLVALAVGRWSSQADEPMKVALASPISHSSTNTSKIAIKPANSTTNSLSLSFRQHPGNSGLPSSLALPSAGIAPAIETVVVLTKKPVVSHGLFSGQPGNGNFGFANFEAGYGQAYDCDSILMRGRNGTTWEETRYVFVKKIVKF